MKKSTMNDYSKYLGKTVKVIIDRPLGSKHYKYNSAYPVNYGYLPDTAAADGEELDAYILGVAEPTAEFIGECIAIIHRLNDNDDKLIVAPKGIGYSDEQIKTLTDFQEKYFKSEIIRK